MKVSGVRYRLSFVVSVLTVLAHVHLNKEYEHTSVSNLRLLLVLAHNATTCNQEWINI